MRISSSETVAGYPILLIRSLLARCQSGDLVVDEVERILRVDQVEARRAISALEDLGYLELCAEYLPHEQWRTTITGNTLANASASRPMRRAKAEQLLAEFMTRVEQLNADQGYIYRVAKVALFGSMLGESAEVGDIDLAIELVPKYDKAEMLVRSEQRIAAAVAEGRRFTNIVDELTWPTREIYRCLRNRSRAISLHPFDEPIELNTPYRVIFDASAPVNELMAPFATDRQESH
jgi:predicted nucleotidyltransferase